MKQRLGPRQALRRKRGEPPRQRFSPAQELRVRHDFIDQTHLKRTSRVDLLAGQKQPASSGSPQQIDRPPQRPRWSPSQFHFGKAEHGVPSRNPEVVVEGDLKTAPQGIAVDQRQRRLGQGVEQTEGLPIPPFQGGGLGG